MILVIDLGATVDDWIYVRIVDNAEAAQAINRVGIAHYEELHQKILAGTTTTEEVNRRIFVEGSGWSAGGGSFEGVFLGVFKDRIIEAVEPFKETDDHYIVDT